MDRTRPARVNLPSVLQRNSSTSRPYETFHRFRHHRKKELAKVFRFKAKHSAIAQPSPSYSAPPSKPIFDKHPRFWTLDGNRKPLAPAQKRKSAKAQPHDAALAFIPLEN